MEIVDYVKKEKELLKNIVLKCDRKPVLAIIQINDDEASNAYIRGKIKDADEVGMSVTLIKYPTNIKERQLIDKIKELNADKSVDGIIVQMPIPKHINENVIKLVISPCKDVDGFHSLSKYQACTPKGIIDYLEDSHIEFEGKNAVVIGRSNIVGKPMAAMLLKHNANVTQLHSKTTLEDMDFYLKHADIIVVAVGKPYFLKKSQSLKKSAVVVDVGINRLEGHLVGDAEPNLDVALQTPVPKGVGLLTRLTLMKNLLEAYTNGIQHK